jgi:hypothetical protein
MKRKKNTRMVTAIVELITNQLRYGGAKILETMKATCYTVRRCLETEAARAKFNMNNNSVESWTKRALRINVATPTGCM